MSKFLNDQDDRIENDYTKFANEYNKQSEIIDNLEHDLINYNNE
ncbi:hypothetical protein NF27_EY00810 [Candidatus Jidaibacter acanthamoeba]|uniref:Uncharacterized protein n=1 Tax=Candidatus Jidaibacter acanthamoebae TaxID=86105 RepID=A0A0C1QYA3_9RICK|nr:hypothetical protein [Candidatus Jidaibacter acanthamoeba]KIE04985.1 hypothetical protein NF27_EY00810 [Candidatus Jidaibacter acanthamoeba]